MKMLIALQTAVAKPDYWMSFFACRAAYVNIA
jgi:hypothetical protein